MVDSSEKAAVVSEQNEMFRAIQKKDKEIRLLKNRLKALESGKKPVESAPNQEIQASSQANISPEVVKSDHNFRPWQRYCTVKGCGEENKEFKDETRCVGCGMHTGSLDVALTLEKCPSCGVSKKVEIISAEAKKRYQEMVKA